MFAECMKHPSKTDAKVRYVHGQWLGDYSVSFVCREMYFAHERPPRGRC
jgi:hypothetical protein